MNSFQSAIKKKLETSGLLKRNLIERLYSVFTLTAKKLIGILPSEARLRLEILQKEYIKQFFFEKRVGSGGTCLKSFPCFG